MLPPCPIIGITEVLCILEVILGVLVGVVET